MKSQLSTEYAIQFIGPITEDNHGRKYAQPYDYQIKIIDGEGNNMVVSDARMRVWLGYIKQEIDGNRVVAYTKGVRNEK
jgi:hypothetical protein